MVSSLAEEEGEDDVLQTTLREDDPAVMDLHRRLRFYILRQSIVDFPSLAGLDESGDAAFGR